MHKSSTKAVSNQVRRMMRVMSPMVYHQPIGRASKDERLAIEGALQDMQGVPVYEKIMEAYAKTIKGDPRAIEFLVTHMLSAYTPDPSNLGMEAGTSEGKTWPTVEVAKRTPQDDVWYIGGLSPTAIVHDYGELVNKEGERIEDTIEMRRDQVKALKAEGKEREGDLGIAKEELKELLKESRYLVNMEDRIIIFLEAPHIETWEYLRPILSHDTYEISYKFTDKTASGQLRTSHVVIRGWPAVIYLKASRSKREKIIWDEVQSRFTTISPKTGTEKYQAAIKFIMQKKGLPGPVFESMLGFNDFKWLEGTILAIRKRLKDIKSRARKVCQEVDANVFWVPFYEEIGKEFPAKEGRNMRDSRRFMTLLQMSAAIDVNNRPVMRIGGAEYIVAVREDYERAVRLFFGEAGEEIFSGLPHDVIDFFKKIPLKAYKADVPITVSKMSRETKAALDKPLSANTIRERYLPPLEHAGVMSREPNPDDKREHLYTVMREDIFPQNSTIYTLFENGGIFSVDTLESRLNHILKIASPESGLYDYNGEPLTAAQMWDKYYSKESETWRGYLNSMRLTAVDEIEEEKTPVPETGVKSGISEPTDKEQGVLG